MKLALSNYLNKPVEKGERVIITLLCLFLVLVFLFNDFITYYGVDACYDGLVARLSSWYVGECEAGSKINEIFGALSILMTLGILMVTFTIRWRPILFIPVVALAQKILFMSALFIHRIVEHANQFSNISSIPFLLVGVFMNLLPITLSIYLIFAALRCSNTRKR